MKKLGRYLILMVVTVVLGACGNGSSNNGEVKIGILQYMEHESLNEAKKGFIEELAANGYTEGSNLILTEKNAQGDQANLQSITQQLKDKNDLILSIATPAAQAMLNADRTTPQLFTAVTDPVSAKLIQSMSSPGGNMTGTTDMAPINKVIDLLLKAKSDIKTIGIIYNSSEQNSKVQYEEAKAYIEGKGLNVETVTVTSTNDVQQAISTLASKVDGVYLPTDNTIASSITVIGDVLTEQKIPSVAGFAAGVEGALCSYGADYEALGRQTAKQAVAILKGKSPSEIPAENPENLIVKVNEDVAAKLGIDPQVIKE